MVYLTGLSDITISQFLMSAFVRFRWLLALASGGGFERLETVGAGLFLQIPSRCLRYNHLPYFLHLTFFVTTFEKPFPKNNAIEQIFFFHRHFI